jgi:hypothetical protein
MVFSITFNNISVISWWSVLLVKETGIPGEVLYGSINTACIAVEDLCVSAFPVVDSFVSLDAITWNIYQVLL